MPKEDRTMIECGKATEMLPWPHCKRPGKTQGILGNSHAKCVKTLAMCLRRLYWEPWCCRFDIQNTICTRNRKSIKDQLKLSQFGSSMRQCFSDYPQDRNFVCGCVLPCGLGSCVFQFPTRKIINKGSAQKRTPVAWMDMPYRSNGEHKNQSLGLRTKTISFSLNRVQLWKPRSLSAMDC